MTATHLLDILPAEILSAICECLGRSHPRSVLSLALANKHWYSVASAFLYRSITFKAHCPEQLAQDAQRCENMLRRDSAFRHVKRFVIHGRLEAIRLEAIQDFNRVSRDDCDDSNQNPLKWQRMPCAKLIGSPYDDDEQTLRTSAVGLGLMPPDRTSAQQVYRSDGCWRPLCRLVKLLPALTDFVFACLNQFPPYLLETLHKHFIGPSPNRLRLHICTFTLRSLADVKIDPYEIALASSPLLHSIWVRYDDTNGYDRQNMPNYHADAVMDLVTGLAPNLKEVRLFHDYGDGEDEDGNYPLPSPPAWKGFPTGACNKGEEGQQSLGSLQYLELDGLGMFDSLNVRSHDARRYLAKDFIQRWEKCTDFSVLHTLKLRQVVLRESLAFLVECCSFSNLTSLTLDYLYEDTTSPEGVELLQRFLCSLPNLRSLELPWKGPVQELGANAFNPGLTRLYLPDEPGTSYHKDLSSIIQRCPLIEDLSVAIPRYRGGAPEVYMYRVIGSLPRLRRLALTLDASATTPEARFFVPQHAESLQPLGEADDLDAIFIFGNGVPKRVVRNALIDSAVDEKLAIAIFRAVSHGKDSKSNITAVPLETLSICVVGGGWIATNAFTGRPRRQVLRPYLCNMARSWRVDRDPRDDRRDVLHAVEVGRDSRLSRDVSHQPKNWQKNSDILPIFRQIWPEKAEGSNWYDDWESWPLERLGDE